MKALTIFHELWVKDAVAQGYTNTTRPARLMNQFIASPRLSSSASVCNYSAQIRTSGLKEEEQVYDGFAAGTLQNATCSAITKRPLAIPYANRSFVFTGLVSESGAKTERLALFVGSPTFDERTGRWISATFRWEKDVRYSATFPTRGGVSFWQIGSPLLNEGHLFRGEDRSRMSFGLSGGSVRIEGDGTFVIEGMTRLKCARKWWDRFRTYESSENEEWQVCPSPVPVGFTDLRIHPNGKISQIFRKP